MDSVFLVQHLHVLPDDVDDIKTIGVYNTYAQAAEAVSRLSTQPGFRDHPAIVDPMTDDSDDGFHISEYRLNQDHWTEGFVTIRHG